MHSSAQCLGTIGSRKLQFCTHHVEKMSPKPACETRILIAHNVEWYYEFLHYVLLKQVSCLIS